MNAGMQPFDPTALGFELKSSGYPEGWRRDTANGECWWIWDSKNQPGFIHINGCELGCQHRYFGARPESHVFAVTLFHHLGLEVTQ